MGRFRFPLGATAALAFFGIVVGFQQCGHPRIAHQQFPPIGETVVLSASADTAPLKADAEYRNVLIYFSMGGRMLSYDDNVVIEMYENQGDSTPVHSFKPNELRDMYLTTGCSNDAARILENALQGDALFCNGSIDVRRVNYIVARGADGKTKKATSYLRDFVKEDLDLIGLTIGME